MKVEVWTKPDLKDYWGILPAGTKRTAGWIRRIRNAPTRTYLVKIYGAEFVVGQGPFRGKNPYPIIFVAEGGQAVCSRTL